MATLNVGIFVYDEVEVLDFAGPFQVFTTAERMARPDRPFATFTVAVNNEVQARGGLYLVERLAGAALALRTARQMDYRWQRAPR